jgi:hypothetical protein
MEKYWIHKQLLIAFLIATIVVIGPLVVISCNKQKAPIAVVSNGDTTLVSPIDDSLYMKLQCKYDSLKTEIVNIAENSISERDILQKENDSLKAIIQTNKKSNCDSLRTALTRANFKVIRVKYYLNLANKNPNKYGVFLKGWLNGLFVDQ